MSKLVLLQSGEAIPYELDGAEATLGRHPDCDIQLQSNMVSRKHARVFEEGGQYYVEDLGSGNGTFLNGKKIEGRTALNHEDRVKLGPLLLRFEAKQPEKAPVPAAAAAASAATAATIAFNLELASGEDDSATVMDAVDNTSGFGLLDAQPEAKLKGILEIARSLAGTADLEALLPKILETLFNVFPQADRGCILLKDPETSKMLPRAYKHRRDDVDDSVKLSRTILDRVLSDKTGILSADAASDSRFEQSESISSLTIRSMMCVPMLSLDGEPTGVIQLDTQNPLQRFQKEDLDLLLAVAGQAALSYESARLMVSAMEKKKQDDEMQIARGVQQALLPEKLPDIEGYQFFASYDSAQAVGGDYYDCFVLDENTVCLSFGDVAGKGVPASLVMSRMSSVVQSTVSHVRDVGGAAAAINNHMCANAVEGRFVTYVLVIIDLKINEMSLVIAGHMSPIIRKADGSCEEFDEEAIGLPIGVLEDYPFEVITRRLDPGEIVVIYTDGVSEAMNPDGDLYTEERVRKFVKQCPAAADVLGKELLADVRRHANGREQNDDITIMTFGRNPA